MPLIDADGMDTMTTIPTSWAHDGFEDISSGIDSTIFGSVISGNEFISFNASLQNSGVTGVDPDSNQVLVAQITTKGQISFDINIEVEVPAIPVPVIVKYVSAFAIGESTSDTLKLSPFLHYPQSCGCADPNFLEYNASFSCNNQDSCRTRIVFGCMDTLACNYDISANYNLPGLCCYPGNCSDRDIGIVCPSLALGRASSPFVNLHPNPLSDELIFQFTSDQEKEYSYSIYNSIGEIVLQKELGKLSGQYTEQVDMSLLYSGIYIFKLYSCDFSTTTKIIKK